MSKSSDSSPSSRKPARPEKSDDKKPAEGDVSRAGVAEPDPTGPNGGGGSGGGGGTPPPPGEFAPKP